MQNIQDKEFDQLLKSQFEEAEIEPSSDLWSAIETKLDVKSKRKQIFPVYRIAAAIAMMGLAVGLLFYPAEKKLLPSSAIIYQHPVVNRTENAKAANIIQQNNTVNPASVLSGTTRIINSKEAAAVKAISDTSKVLYSDSAVHAKNALAAMQPLSEITHPDNKTIRVKQEKMRLPKPSPEEIALANANSAPATANEVTNENMQKENKRIRNVGDLVNLVVDKLDKREEKVIQFETDDDNSSLVALNIGIFKFNRKKQK